MTQWINPVGVKPEGMIRLSGENLFLSSGFHVHVYTNSYINNVIKICLGKES